MPENPDIFIVLRKPEGSRALPDWQGAVYTTHKQAIDAMNKHKAALRVYSKKDASEGFVSKTKNARRFR